MMLQGLLHKVLVLETKNHMYLASNNSDPILTFSLDNLLGIELKVLPNFLTLSLLNPAAKLHPILMETHFSNSMKLPNNFYNIQQTDIDKISSVDLEVNNHSVIIYDNHSVIIYDNLSRLSFKKRCQ